MECKELKTLQLREPSRDGRGASLKKQNYLVTFWQDSDAIKRIEEKKSRKGPEEEERAKEIEELFRKLETKDMEVRSEVQNKLGEIGQPVLVKIDEMLEDGYSGTRKEASLLLGLMGDKSAVETLTQVLKRDVDEGVRCKAVISLGLIEEAKKSGKTIETLIKILKNDFHPNVRETAAIVLSLTKEPRVINALIQALNDSQAQVPSLLAKLKDSFLGTSFIPVIRTPRGPTVGQTAVLSLVNIGKPAVNPLTQAMKKYDLLDFQVRKLAEEV
ncbi:HEAT repeat domain-containing protein, partial [Candidatus Bathyarchaeota archaeon]|nr:HEAT repeat domain-containing protein [Candidatus Bathyarchaeota archaeon]